MSEARICVVSAKGGTGKSTVAVNLARAYAAMGRTVLLVDMDTYCRSLDILTGTEDSTMYDISDVLAGRVAVDRAVIRLPQADSIMLLAGSARMGSRIPTVAFEKLISQAEKLLRPMVIIMDTHAPDGSADAALAVADHTLVVTECTGLALRATEACGIYLAGKEAPDVRMVLNSFRMEDDSFSIREAIDTAGIPLVGVIPHDPELAVAQEQGKLARDLSSKNTMTAFRSIAVRLYGLHAELFKGFKGIDRDKIIDR